ncbi:hypothetical protein CPB84DRAFT_1854307 [Gymnopilus junonius]|uniref:Uncharacterized protein n=1 Tax=Gymnopilus junonius TaxID=109634 RepID=A0A9P5NAV3_GYMJU|nr:hypothetical protein CPB84DRAFT_1854307 [Gymnopilus junonius]
MPPSHLLWASQNGLSQFDCAVPDSFLCTLFYPLLGTYALNHHMTEAAILVCVEFGIHYYSLHPGVAHSLFQSLVDIATIITTAANNFTPFLRDTRPLPLTIPMVALQDVELRYPIIALALTCRDQDILCRPFATRSEVHHLVRVVRHIVNYYVGWIAEGIKHSIRQGSSSLWNWSAYWGVPWEEFIMRTGRYQNNAKFLRIHGLFKQYKEDFIENSLAAIVRPTASDLYRQACFRSSIGQAYPGELDSLTAAMAACGLTDRQDYRDNSTNEYPYIYIDSGTNTHRSFHSVPSDDSMILF